ncbi:putative T7SS-secreted protein [Amycolatopsis taiwanensis]|uniref:Putative T7SS secretion signal domain-containing protein n=1 Tax=Amycolatopsis taiwanensis TaxID=342230 RepID=A0A9W6R0R3_9PSEU|nr:hypothetical protein [Amycolatopsis taiwanensis]GLY67034.1 hypothetical protein Atai01_36530 [Amycolatopsis taiwanensis]
MAAELGETTNPKELIPGEPELIVNNLRRLVANIDGIGAAGDSLRGIDPTQWTGDGADAFRELFGEEPPKWFQTVEVLSRGGRSLADYGDVLIWAQAEAQRAIEMHTQAEAASRAAAAQYKAQARVPGQFLSPFQDPGEALAQDAQAVLDNARERLAAVGDLAARAFGFKPDGEGGYSKKLGDDKEFGADKRENDEGGWQTAPGGKSYQREWGTGQSEGMLTDTVGETLKALGFDLHEQTWSASAGVDVASGGLEARFESGPWSGSGKVGASVFGAGAQASATVNDLGITGAASAEAYVVKDTAEGSVKLGGHAEVSGKAEATVGGEVHAKGSIGAGGAQGSIGGFAGGKVETDLGAEVAGVNVGLHAEAQVGFGAEASGQFGMGDDGKFHIGASLGLSVGIGGKLGFDIAIDPGEVVNTVKDVVHDVGEIASDVGHELTNVAEAVGDFLGL